MTGLVHVFIYCSMGALAQQSFLSLQLQNNTVGTVATGGVK